MITVCFRIRLRRINTQTITANVENINPDRILAATSALNQGGAETRRTSPGERRTISNSEGLPFSSALTVQIPVSEIRLPSLIFTSDPPGRAKLAANVTWS